MKFTFEISLSALISGAIGGFISYYLSKRLNKKSHQIALREEKFDDFTSQINWLRDMMDIVLQGCSMQVLNYNEYGMIEAHSSMSLFNKIYETASKCSTLVKNYGRLYNVGEFKYDEVIIIHGLALDVAIRMNYFSKNSSDINSYDKISEIQAISNKLDDAKIRWRELRVELVEICKKADEKRNRDLG